MLLAGVSSTGGTIYYADVDVPINPKWIQGGGTANFIAGSYGMLYSVATGGSVPKMGAYDSSSPTAISGTVSLIQVSVDDSTGGIGGVTSTGTYQYAASSTTALATVPGTVKWVSLSNRAAYCVGQDTMLGYASNASSGNWIRVNSTPGWKQVSFDGGVVCAIAGDGTVWCADQGITAAGANWTQQGSKAFTQISLKAGRLVGIGTDGVAYYSNTYKSPSWTALPMQPYNASGTSIGASPISLKQIELFHPSTSARKKRFATSGQCNSNEESIGNYCYQPCGNGQAAVGPLCPAKRKQVLAVASCPSGSTFINNACFVNCPAAPASGGPDPANPEQCLGVTSNKVPVPLNTNVVPAGYSCPADGSVPGRYIRIRPTANITNNKLCISKLVVQDSAGNSLLVAPSGSSGSRVPPSIPTAYATDGTCMDAPIGGSSCPPLSSYTSSRTYDGESDGGKMKRISHTYWEVDLKAVRNIKTITFTGCKYVSEFTGTPAAGSTATPSQGPDQLTGMRLEVLGASNAATAAPIASRILGPNPIQTFTFNYVRKDEDIANKCFEPNCPVMEGIESKDNGNNTCIYTVTGITNRSVTKPIDIGVPSCVPYTGSYPGFTADINRTPVSVKNWVLDPSKPSQSLSCDILTGSILKPITSMVNVTEALGGTGRDVRISYTKDGSTAYTNPDTGYMCVQDANVRCSDRTNFNYLPTRNACIRSTSQQDCV